MKEIKTNFYSDRFDTEYLSFLKKHLDIEELKKTAEISPKEINGKKYEKCININFCGLSATTLFHANNDDIKNVTSKNINLRTEISETFRDLFSKKNLESLNNDFKNGPFYLRVRFCFSYLYSDYPICLMKAEEDAIWSGLVNKPIDSYYINKSLTKDEFDSSHIQLHQRNSLKGITNILKNNNDLVFLEESEVKENTIQVRFSVIPSAICTLIINDTAFGDPYMYAKSGDQLALNFPVITLPANDPALNNGYNYLKSHFFYLWRHDLTLFCKDATNYKSTNISGLAQVLTPDIISGIAGTDWKYKIEKIWLRKNGKNIKKTPADEEEIRNWKINVTKKFILCTRKMKEQTSKKSDINISIGMKKEFYYFKIEFKSRNIVFEFLQSDTNITFKALAHYSYAILSNKLPIMHKVANLKFDKLVNELKSQLNNVDLDKKRNGKIFFNELFTNDSATLRLRIEKENIDFGEDCFEKIKKLKYKTCYQKDPSKSEFGVFQYTDK